MKYLIPFAALAVGIVVGFLGGRATAPGKPDDVFDSAPPDPGLPPQYADFGKEAAAFVTWYEANGGDASVSETVLREHLGILRRKAKEHRLVPVVKQDQPETSGGR